MHALHTTDAFITGSTPHGESNRVYGLFTHDFGFVYAHGQGVRELKNRNRYALVTGEIASVTLVRGREAWRITGARQSDGGNGHAPPLPGTASARHRRVLYLLRTLVPRDEPLPGVFSTLLEFRNALVAHHTTYGEALESLAVLRILHTLGYVGPLSGEDWKLQCLSTGDFPEALLARVAEEQRAVTALVNNALASANT